MASKSSTHLGPLEVVRANEQKVGEAHESLDELVTQAIRGRAHGAFAVRVTFRQGRLGTVRKILELDKNGKAD